VVDDWVCPINYYEFPELILNIYFNQQGPADYLRWRLSSDDMAATMSGAPVNNGASAHFDWMDGWFHEARAKWEANGIGVLDSQGHTLGDGVISPTEKMNPNNNVKVFGSPTATRSPQVDMSTEYPTNVASNMFEIPSSYNGPVTVPSGGS
jgi:hypothetical protein